MTGSWEPLVYYTFFNMYSCKGTINLNPLLKESFIMCKELDEVGTYSWYTYAKNVLKETDIEMEKINCKTIFESKKIKLFASERVSNFYKEMIIKKLNDLTNNNKIYLYKYLKLENNMEYYLSHPNKATKKCLTKFRKSDHDVFIERGRYLKIPREDRKCKICGIIDDENHFFFNCKINQEIRKDFLKYYELQYNNFSHLNYIEKLQQILNPSNHKDIDMVVSFIKQSFELRGGDPQPC